MTDLASGLGMPVCLGRGVSLQGRFLPGFNFFLFGSYFWSLLIEFIRVTSITLVDIVIVRRGRVAICCIRYPKEIYLSRCWSQRFLLFIFLFVYSEVMLSSPHGVKCKSDLFVGVLESTLRDLVLCYMFDVVFLLLQVLYESL